MDKKVQLATAITPTHILGSTGTSGASQIGYTPLNNIKELLGITDLENDMSEMIQRLQNIQDLLVEIRDVNIQNNAKADTIIALNIQSNTQLESLDLQTDTIIAALNTIADNTDNENP